MKRRYLTQTLALLLINLCWNFSYAYLQLRNTAKISIFWDQHDPFLQIINLGLWLLVWSVWRITQAEVLNTPMLQLRTGSKLKYFQKLGLEAVKFALITLICWIITALLAKVFSLVAALQLLVLTLLLIMLYEWMAYAEFAEDGKFIIGILLWLGIGMLL